LEANTASLSNESVLSLATGIKKDLLGITTNGDSRIFSPEEVATLFTLRSTESHFDKGLSGIVLFGIFFKLGPDKSLDFLELWRKVP
jgi:hypothetical protein